MVTVTVTIANDPDTGDISAGTGMAGTLRQAINDASASPGTTTAFAAAFPSRADLPAPGARTVA